MDFSRFVLADFPLYIVEMTKGDNLWMPVTDNPFRSAQEAQLHITRLLDQLSKLESGMIRISVYTEKQWRQDLIDRIMDDHDAMRRALSVLQTQTLANLFHQE